MAQRGYHRCFTPPGRPQSGTPVLYLSYSTHQPLSMHLETASAMDDLTREVRAHRRSQKDIRNSHLNRHARSHQRCLRYPKFFHSFRRVTLRGRLKRCPAKSQVRNSSCESTSQTYMIPGATALTLIPLGACCCAKLLVKVAIAPFVEL